MNGTDLLAEFRATRAELAFSELVRRFTNLVYSIAKRRVRDVTLAQEITQIVFIRLANSPPRLDKEAQLLAWLHRTTVHVSIDLWRSETRRRAREQHAVAMQNDRTEEIAWSEMTPVLDEALDRLDESDRQTILLRFFHQKTMAELARDCGISEDAAKMRVSRALDRLRRQLAGHGTTCSAALLATLLLARSVEAAPPGLAPLLTTIKIAAPAGLAAGLATLLLHTSKAKLVTGIVTSLMLTGTILVLLLTTRPGVTRVAGSGDSATQAHENGSSNHSEVAATSETTAKAEPADPDPLKLLQGIIRARRRIVSGIAEFDVFTIGNVTRPDDTNQIRLTIRFEDGRYWAESIGREYRYVTPIPGGPEADEIIQRADQMSREQAVRRNLLEPFPSHHVTFYDSQAITDYWETGSAYPSTVINKPGQSSVFIFDPRCLGICTFLYVEHQVESCLTYKEAKSLLLVGKELVEGAFAWHIQILTKTDFTSDIWVDALQPTRVLKLQANGDVSISRYSETNLKDPLPVEVRNISFRNGVARYEIRVTRLNTRYDVPIDPLCWTLDGLHMKVGTQVTDTRISRSLGYWTGTGLSELPRQDKPQSGISSRTQLEALLESNPASVTFKDAQWIILNSPDGPAVQKAADVILREYIRIPHLVGMAQELERMRHNCSSNLLKAMLDQNPSADVRGNACLALAALVKDASHYGTNQQATAEAIKLYKRVISDFGQVKQGGHSLAELAQPQLNELRSLVIGKVAPDIDGYDLYDHRMTLSDYRGKVVVLVFWSALCLRENEAREYQRLVQQMEGKPFALLGIHADNNNDNARALAEKYAMTWPSFKDAREGSISRTYNINSWTTIYVLDRKGVIRYRGLYHVSEIAAAVDRLLKS